MAVKTPISIFCRIKPNSIDSVQEIQEYTINNSNDRDTLTICSVPCNSTVNHKPDAYNFQFLKVFDQGATQDLIYETVAQPVVRSALRGYNGTVFAYGQTGSGKTFTISGVEGNPGIVPRALQDIFIAINEANDEEFEVQMSYLEIYNEHSNDLLGPTCDGKKKISLREGSDKLMEWHNLSVCPVQGYEEALRLLAVGDTNRIVSDTPMNLYSSRSHTILTIYLTIRVKESLQIRKAKLNLVDLAGSERVHKTGEEGIVLEEARYINLSLHYLEQVIVALSDNSRTHVPYRNCTMTAALRDSLGSNCMTVMVANIALDSANIEETVSTCRFAQRVALVSNELFINTERDLSGENKQLRAEIRQLRSQCGSLLAKVKELERADLRERVNAVLQPLEQTTDEVLSLAEETQTTKKELSTQQLQTDINSFLQHKAVYLIGWLQDELKTKNGESSLIVHSPAQNDDEKFDNFVSSLESEEKDWKKTKESEQKAVEALNLQMASINTVHQDILKWWRKRDRSLVSEILAEHTIHLLGSTSHSELDPGDNNSDTDITNGHTMESLLVLHSDLLKDFQLIKSRLQSSKRSLQRIKRKYSVEFNNWKKAEKSSAENLIKNAGDLESCKSDYNADLLEKHQLDRVTHIFPAENKNPVTNYVIDLYKYDKLSHWNDKDLMSETSFSLDDSDLNSVFGENDTVFSTSTLFSSRNRVEVETRSPALLPRYARSMPTCSYQAPPAVQLTGEQDIDEEIIAFYQNKCKN